MPYVKREGGKIVGQFANFQQGYAEEFLDDDNPEIVAIGNERRKKERNAAIKQRLVDIDSKSIRAIREYLSGVEGADQRIIALESEAASEQAKLEK